VPVRSFDRPRERPAPAAYEGRSLAGEPVAGVFERMTLVVAIKPACDGCRDFVHSPLDELGDLDVLVVSADDDVAGEWASGTRPVVVAPRLLSSLDIRSAPFYALIDPSRGRVVSEGFVFAPSQVADEIRPHLAP
jgi:hypothetical protein